MDFAHIAAIGDAMSTQKRPNTLKAYGRAWLRFAAWCGEGGYDPLSADPWTCSFWVSPGCKGAPSYVIDYARYRSKVRGWFLGSAGKPTEPSPESAAMARGDAPAARAGTIAASLSRRLLSAVVRRSGGPWDAAFARCAAGRTSTHGL